MNVRQIAGMPGVHTRQAHVVIITVPGNENGRGNLPEDYCIEDANADLVV